MLLQMALFCSFFFFTAEQYWDGYFLYFVKHLPKGISILMPNPSPYLCLSVISFESETMEGRLERN